MIAIYKYLFRFGRIRVVCDCHNKALKREVSGNLAGLFKWFKSAVFGGVDLIVVTNRSLVPIANGYCNAVAILRDPLANWHGKDVKARQQNKAEAGHVLFICSFDKDEPVELIFESAQLIAHELDRSVVISGRVPPNRIPDSVRCNKKISLPGFMATDEYQHMLFLASAVVVLTEDDDCLVCGAYESLGASRPTVLSATNSLQACFGASAIYTGHTPEEVVTQVQIAISRQFDTHVDRGAFQDSWAFEWEEFCRKLEQVLA